MIVRESPLTAEQRRRISDEIKAGRAERINTEDELDIVFWLCAAIVIAIPVGAIIVCVTLMFSGKL